MFAYIILYKLELVNRDIRIFLEFIFYDGI